jgi:predicted Rdx family selenoprotein
MEIAIRYCAERGFEEAALVFARRLFATFDEEIASLALVPVEDEDLAVYLDGRLVHSASETGRLPRLTDLRHAGH